MDVNAAPREAILRVPGIGYRNVERILSIRRYHTLLLADLRKLNVRVKQALGYIVTPDHLPASPPLSGAEPVGQQLDLFAPVSALTGSL